MVQHCYSGKPWARELEWHLGLVIKSKMGSRNSSLLEERHMPMHGYVCVLWDYKTQMRATEKRDDRRELVLNCCGRELQRLFIMCVRYWAIVQCCCKALQRSYGSMHCSAAATGWLSNDTKFWVGSVLTRDKRPLLFLFWSWMRFLYNNMLLYNDEEDRWANPPATETWEGEFGYVKRCCRLCLRTCCFLCDKVWRLLHRQLFRYLT